MISNLSVKAKLSFGFGFLTIIIIMICLLSVLSLSGANKRFSDYIDGLGKRKEIAAELLDSAQQRAIAARDLVLVTSSAELESEHSAVVSAHKQVGILLLNLRAATESSSLTDTMAEERRLLSVIEDIEARYGPVAMDIVNLAINGEKDAAILKINKECLPLLKKLMAAVKAYKEFGTEVARGSLEKANTDYIFQRNILVASSIFALLLALLVSVFIIRGLTRALGAEPIVLSTIAQRVASGDMRLITEVKSAPRGSVLFSLGEMQASLSLLIGQVHSSSSLISTAAVDLSSATEQTRIGVGN
ncbi:methyl-accepting chemotaxis protein [Pseudomonas lurida]|uniref:MCP four helix bundle domain-containing protein n=1 Tax=Pseudomonas lurida TaxID=244566 RepID=UPI001656C561|nr:MCP four helix bundle domain-containing protein [Pseudomonas lurida]MBC8982373.1 methyl-accepting chemotaxis protein [Pseudomonas lurida]